MNIDKWVNGFKIRAFEWIDKKNIYLNVQYFAPGQSIERPPVWDKTVYITNNEAGKNLIDNYLDSLVNHVASMKIQEGTKVVLTA